MVLSSNSNPTYTVPSTEIFGILPDATKNLDAPIQLTLTAIPGHTLTLKKETSPGTY